MKNHSNKIHYTYVSWDCLLQSEELAMQKKLRTEVIQLEDSLAQVRKEYEMLRVEFEQNLAANEQTGKFNLYLIYLSAQTLSTQECILIFTRKYPGLFLIPKIGNFLGLISQ